MSFMSSQSILASCLTVVPADVEVGDKVVGHRIFQAKRGKVRISQVGVAGDIGRDRKSVVGGKQRRPVDRFRFPVQILAVAAKEGFQGCQYPAGQAGAVIDGVKRVRLRPKMHPAEAGGDFPGPQAIQFFCDERFKPFGALGKITAGFLVLEHGTVLSRTAWR